MEDKQWYVDQHRAMWTWIADQIEQSKSYRSICFLKKKWCEEHGFSPRFNCFACEYDNKKHGFRCQNCLFFWGERSRGMQVVPCEFGYYGALKRAETRQEQAELARMIANLPVRRMFDMELLIYFAIGIVFSGVTKIISWIVEMIGDSL